jgi:hypothetical protein
MLNKYFYKKQKLNFKRKAYVVSSIKHLRVKKNAGKILTFYFKKGKNYSTRSYLHNNLQYSRYSRRNTFIYMHPFYINRLFISKLFTAKLIKRLANVW